MFSGVLISGEVQRTMNRMKVTVARVRQVAKRAQSRDNYKK